MLLFIEVSLFSYLVLLVGEATPLWSKPQLLCRQPMGLVTQTGDGHGSHEDATDAGHGHQGGKDPTRAGLNSGGQGQSLAVIVVLWLREQGHVTDTLTRVRTVFCVTTSLPPTFPTPLCSTFRPVSASRTFEIIEHKQPIR